MEEDKNKYFVDLSTDRNKVFALIELTKSTTGNLPSAEELNEGLETLGIDFTENLKAELNSAFGFEFKE